MGSRSGFCHAASHCRASCPTGARDARRGCLSRGHPQQPRLLSDNAPAAHPRAQHSAPGQSGHPCQTQPPRISAAQLRTQRRCEYPDGAQLLTRSAAKPVAASVGRQQAMRAANPACPTLSHANAACVIIQPFGEHAGYGETGGGSLKCQYLKSIWRRKTPHCNC